MNIPPTPYYKDLEKMDIMLTNEINFNKIIIQPLFQIINTLLEEKTSEFLKNSLENFNIMEEMKNSIIEEKSEERSHVD